MGATTRARAEQFGLAQHIAGFYAKDGRDGDDRYLTAHLPVATGPVVFVDDRPEDLADGLEVIAVFPYITENRHDRGLSRVADRAGLDLGATLRPDAPRR